MNRRDTEDGVVLLLILVIIVAIVGSVYAFTATTTLDVLSLRNRTDRIRAEMLAHSGLEIALQILAEDVDENTPSPRTGKETWGDEWRILSQESIIPEEDHELKIKIQDSGSWISLNALIDLQGKGLSEARPFLLAVLTKVIDDMPGRDEDKFYDPEKLADGIMDWIDVDSVTRLGENEVAYYAKQGGTTDPQNRPIFSLQELSAVPGMDQELLTELKSYFSPFPFVFAPGAAGVNPNTAPPHVLATIFYGAPASKKRLLDARDVFTIMRSRERDEIFCRGAGEKCTTFQASLGLAGQNVFPQLQFASSIFDVRIEARVRESRFRMRTVIDRTDPAEPMFIFHRVL